MCECVIWSSSEWAGSVHAVESVISQRLGDDGGGG